MEPIIRVQGLKKSFGSQSILRGVDLEVEPRETLVILGRSGCGKSVLLKHLTGLMVPESGDVWVRGMQLNQCDTKGLHDLRLRLGMVFQGAALFDSMNVGENIVFSMKEHQRLSDKAYKDRILECLSMVDLEGSEDKMPSELSGGMRKRVAIARAIAMHPELILYDEPTTGLDPITADVINALMVKLGKKTKATSLVVTHDIQSAFGIASRIAFMHEGRVRWTGTPSEAKKSKDKELQAFLKSHI